MGKEITTKHGSTDIDILLKDRTIIECKNIDWSKKDTETLNKIRGDLGQKIKRFRAYDNSAKIIITFKDSVDPSIKTWLKDEKKVDVEVI